jgi:hypothetical protein
VNVKNAPETNKNTVIKIYPTGDIKYACSSLLNMAVIYFFSPFFSRLFGPAFSPEASGGT